MTHNRLSHFKTFVELTLLYSLLVILWGAWVRISGSGDGCGESWPLCHGERDGRTWVELSHRLTSGLYGFIIIGLVIWSYRLFPKGHWVRKLSVLSLIFTVLEALIGARLVLAGLVGTNASFDRGLIMAVHLLNTFFLTGTLTLIIAFTDKGYIRRRRPLRVSGWLGFLTIVGFVLVGMSGAFAALSTTLYPSESLLAGLAQDFDSNAPLYIKLRAYHPILAVGFIGALLPIIASWKRSVSFAKHSLNRFLIVLLATGAIGLATLLLLSPVWLKLTHLLFSQILWIFLLFAFTTIFIED